MGLERHRPYAFIRIICFALQTHKGPHSALRLLSKAEVQ